MHDTDDYPHQSDMAQPILMFIANNGGAIDFSKCNMELADWLAEHYGLTPEQRGRIDRDRPSKNNSVWINHIQWARAKMVKRGLLHKPPPRGIWRLTSLGYDELNEHEMPGKLSIKHAVNSNGHQTTIVAEADESSFPEGKEKYQLHRKFERDISFTRRVKQMRLRETGRLICEVCNFDFFKAYGMLGEGFIEAHHTVPVSELDGISHTNISDLALVCSNCHRMLHRRRPWLSHDELKNLLKHSSERNPPHIRS